MKNMKIGTRLGMGFLLIVLLMLGIAIIGVLKLGNLNAGTKIIVEDRAPKVVTVHNLIVRLNREARSFRNVLLFKDAAQIKEELDRIKAAAKEAAQYYQELESGIRSAKGKELLAVALGYRVKFGEAIKAFDAAVENGQKEAAFGLLVNKIRPVQLSYMDALNKLIDYQTELMNESGREAESTYNFARLLMLGMAAGAIVLSLMIAISVTRSITVPINEAVQVAQTVAKGDLTSRVEVHSTDETGQLMQALKDMNESLQQIVGNVRGSTETIATASSQIATGNMDLSARTEEQASSLEETASSMEELTSTVRQNAENAAQANQLSITATDVAVKGGEVVSEVVQTMNAINESSKKMADIINVIDGIAFQTNILALNAAVEAARAGEQGRGFAVVATEVRNLAQRSAGAAREIKELIEDSMGRVEIGSKLVEQAGTTIGEVVSSVKRVQDIMSEITAASREQSEGIEQVNHAVMQMDQVTQQNAALVEEAAAAAASLQDQAQVLTDVVSVFRLNGSVTAKPAAKPVAVAKQAKAAVAVIADKSKELARKAVPPARPRQAGLAALPAAAPAGGSDWEEF